MPTQPNPAASTYHAPRNVDELTARNIQTVISLENSARQDRTRAEGVIDAITTFFGRLAIIYIHLAWFVIWIGVNVMLPKAWRFDPYPFEFLVFTLSLEAIFLSIFILISQTRQGRLDERRNHLELQINLLSEQENTKMLWMLERIAKHIGADVDGDPDVQMLEEATRPDQLLEQIDRTLEQSQQQSSENHE